MRFEAGPPTAASVSAPSELPLGISVVIPVYNSAETLPELIARLTQTLERLGEPHEIILVNDGSHDASWATLAAFSKKDPSIRGINLLRNYGQHNALLAGARAARFDRIVTMDDDLQNPPEEIPRLISDLNADIDVIYGVPATQQHGFLRDLASTITKLALQGSMGASTARNVSAFRAFRSRLTTAFADYSGPYVSMDVLLTWGTTRFGSVIVQHDPRQAGQSNYTLGKLLVHAMNMMTGFSTRPLHLASLVGFGLTIFGVLLLAYVLIRYVIEPGVAPGFALLASALTIFSGAQMFCLGIIGEYLARVHFRTMDKPPYAIREVTCERS
jgi:glycosyltransferase involved in cell wall biosynthesis